MFNLPEKQGNRHPNMTALKEFERLESTGLWRENAEAQRREVVVSFGDATLVLTDQNDMALAHWSLAALVRQNPGTRPALFSPDEDGSEMLELSDDTMVAAIGKIQSMIASRGAHPGRLRRGMLAVVFLALALFMVFWLPGAIKRHTAEVVPSVLRTEIGANLLTRVQRLTGPPCQNPAGLRALEHLRQRVAPALTGLIVVPSAVNESVHLPGGLLLLNKSLVEDHEDPEVAAGYIVAEYLRSARHDPLLRLLDHTGLWGSLRLLTRGSLSEKALDAYAETLLTSPAQPLPDDILLKEFSDAGVRSSPYAYAIDISGETTLALIEADPFRSQSPPELLSDDDWVRLQNICSPS